MLKMLGKQMSRDQIRDAPAYVEFLEYLAGFFKPIHEPLLPGCPARWNVSGCHWKLHLLLCRALEVPVKNNGFATNVSPNSNHRNQLPTDVDLCRRIRHLNKYAEHAIIRAVP